jgi:hypothetical protein
MSEADETTAPGDAATGTSAGLALDESVARLRKAMATLTRLDGWPVLDIRHLAYRRKPRGGSLIANGPDAFGPLNEAATEDDDLRPGETLLSQSYASRLPAFERADARLKVGRDMLREAFAATEGLRPPIRRLDVTELDVTRITRLSRSLAEALDDRTDVAVELRDVERLIDDALAYVRDNEVVTVAVKDDEGGDGDASPTDEDEWVRISVAAEVTGECRHRIQRWTNRSKNPLASSEGNYPTLVRIKDVRVFPDARTAQPEKET